MSVLKKIDPAAEYFLHRIAREGWLGTKSVFVCRRMLVEHEKTLKPRFVGSGRATRILVSGKNIIHFLAHA